MKTKIKEKDYLKIGILLFISILTLTNCSKEYDDIEQQNEIVTINKISFEKLNENKNLKKVLQNIKNKKRSTTNLKNSIANDGSFIILTDNILETQTDSTINYTFPLQRPIFDNTFFENFVISKFGTEYKYFIVKYELPTPENFENMIISFTSIGVDLIDIDDVLKTVNNVIFAPPCVHITYSVCGNGGNPDGHGATGGNCVGSFPIHIDTSGCFSNIEFGGGYTGGNTSVGTPNNNGGSYNSSPNGATAIIKDVKRNYASELIANNFSKTDPVWDLLNSFGTLHSDINNFLEDNNNSQASQDLMISILNEIIVNPDIDTFEQSVNNLTLFNSKEPETSIALDIQNDLIDCFNTTSNQNGFHSITIYIDQPVANSADTYKIEDGDVNVGHTFIELEQSSNLNINRKVFGFYPSNGVSPSEPEIAGVFIYDDNHEYDISLRIELTPSQFNSIITIMDNFNNNPLPYNLNTFNCSDFGLSIINSTGANINDTFGEWALAGVVLGGGTNPGNLGQDIRNLVNNQPPNTLNIDTNGGNANNSITPCN